MTMFLGIAIGIFIALIFGLTLTGMERDVDRAFAPDEEGAPAVGEEERG